MARKVAHEIKNPLTPIQLSAEHLLRVYEDRRGDFDRALRESLSYIISEVENLRRIAQDFMELARDTSLRQEELDLRDVVTATVDPYRRLLAERILFTVDFEAGDFRLRGDAAKLQAALRNLLINAVESITRSGEVRLRLRREGDRLILEVRDTGPGMDAATLDKIFEPYFSTKPAGTGLGLPIARKVIEDHGGSIRLASAPGEGTTVTIELPALV
jgi:nitrogen fixation/metabolism regulation signal transduction histidine kinase